MTSRMSVPRERIAELCRQYGLLLNGKLPSDIDGAQLLWALSGNESAFGLAFGPRHEPGYCYISHGHYSTSETVIQLTKDYGCLAHCSLGPWQIMASNARGFSPIELLVDEEKACHAAVGFLKSYVLPVAKNLDQIADEYNTGSLKGVPPAKYISDLHLHYQVPMPQVAANGVNQ